MSSDVLQALYLLALVVGGGWALWKADEPMVRTVLLLALNWLVLAAARDAYQDATPIKTMMLMDFAAGVLILLPRVGDAQLVIGDLFFAQLGLHTVMLATGEPAFADHGYRVALNLLGWLQILLLLVGTHYGSGKRFRLAGRGRGNGGDHAGYAHARREKS